jgi:coproporphyrinogen III oxidase-like Fe-S oxidoreductase
MNDDSSLTRLLLCNYCGCNKRITQDKSKADIYLDYLANEMRQISAVSP